MLSVHSINDMHLYTRAHTVTLYKHIIYHMYFIVVLIKTNICDFPSQDFHVKMESLQQRREELERKEQDLKDSLLKFDKFLKVHQCVCMHVCV